MTVKKWLLILFMIPYMIMPASASLKEHATVSPYESLDPAQLKLASVSALIMDAESGEPLFLKNEQLVMPVASLTKVMTAMVVLDSGFSLDERITIKPDANKAGKNAYSRIRIESTLKRRDLLRLALMSSENRAANALGSSMPGGLSQFVKQMNRKAEQLGMRNTLFVDATGLSTQNISTATDLSLMVQAALNYPLIKQYSVSPRFTAEFRKPKYRLHYGNTNLLVHRTTWDIQLSKTGYLDEAGRCLVMGVVIDDRPIVMVLLDSFGKRTPIGDAGRIRQWMLTGRSGKVSRIARAYEQEKTRKMGLDQSL